MTGGAVKHVEVQPVEQVVVVEKIPKKVQAEVNLEVANEVQPLPVQTPHIVEKVKEVNVQPVTVVKEVSNHYNPRRWNNFRNTHIYNKPVYVQDNLSSQFINSQWNYNNRRWGPEQYDFNRIHDKVCL